MIIRHKYKVDRTLLQNTLGTSKSSFNKKKYCPGVHKKKIIKYTDYKTLLISKQRIRAIYRNIKEKQLYKIFQLASKNIDYKKTIVQKLETRLDSILFRSGCVTSFIMARQLISHRHIIVNNRIETSCSFVVKSGYTIEFTKQSNEICKKVITRTNRKCPNHIIIENKENEPIKIIINIDNISGDIPDYISSSINLNDITNTMRLYRP